MSSGSKEADERKRQREESPHVSCLDSPTSPGNVFAERLKSNECRNFDELFKELGKRSKGI